MNTTRRCRSLFAAAALLVALAGCERTPKKSNSAAEPPPAPSNRIDVPQPVRTNLGITFAPVEYRDVARTLRLAGRFELRPSARREQRAPVAGRIQLLAEQYRPVKAGDVLYRIDSSAWRDLSERIAALEAQVESMTPLRDAHRVHEEALAEKVQLWTDRLAALETLRAAGGADATRVMEASATLIATRADLAEIMEKDAELEARQRSIEADLRALLARRQYLLRVAGAAEPADPNMLEVRADVDGVVESIALAEGGLAEESALILTLVQPQALRFRAQGLQADLGRLRDGLPAQIVAASADANLPPIPGALRLAPTADAERRTIDLLVEPTDIGIWAKSGIVARVEIVLEGGEVELAVPLAAVVRDGGTPILFRRDPAAPDVVIRLDADLGVSDGRWVVVKSGLREGDQVVVGGNYQLMLATSGSAPKGGHFHSDGTWHEGDH